MDILNKVREAISSNEEKQLLSATKGSPIPPDYIPAIDLSNFLDPEDSGNEGDPDKTGIKKAFSQNSLDKAFGGDAKFRPKWLQGNSNNANDARKVYRIDVTNGGSGYVNGATVAISGVGTGATAKANVTNGVIVSIEITAQGSGYTSVPTVIIQGNGAGTGATATAFVTEGGQIDASLIYPSANSPMRYLNPATGEYEGPNIYTQEQVDAIANKLKVRYFKFPITSLYGSGAEMNERHPNGREFTYTTFAVPIERVDEVLRIEVNSYVFLDSTTYLNMKLERATSSDFTDAVQIQNSRQNGLGTANTTYNNHFVDDLPKTLNANGSPKTYYYRVRYWRAGANFNNFYTDNSGLQSYVEVMAFDRSNYVNTN